MSGFYPFIIAGLVSGSVYGLTATGLVLTYKTSGIFNFAHGSVAAAGAYLFFQLRQEWSLPWPLALVLVVCGFGPLFGLALELLGRWLAGAPTASKVVATVGLLTGVQGLLIVVYGAPTRNLTPFLPTSVYSLGNVNVGADQLLVCAIAALSTVGLTVYLKRSRTGTAMRGVVDDPDLLDLAGTSPVRVRRLSWAIGSAFAVLSGVLLAPSVGLDATVLTLIAVQAFGAAAVGRFQSLPLTFAGGLGLGVAASVSTKYVNDYPLLSGLPPSLPFIVLFGVLVLTQRGRFVELGLGDGRRWSSARADVTSSPKAVALRAAPVVAALAVVPLVVGTRLPVYTTAVIYVLLFASLRLLVATSGQVSLCHVTFAAVGATTFAHLSTGLGLPWLVALLLSGVVTVPVGAIVAIPAIRLSGLYLALATFGFGVLTERFAYPMGVMFGKDGMATAGRPSFGIFDATSDRGFYYVCLAVVLAGLWAIHLVNRSRLGRLLRGLADSPLALSTLGAGVTVTRVLVFCISAYLAGIAGALYLSFSGTTSGISFTALLSLSLIVILMISGRGELRAPLVAAAALHILPAYVDNQTIVAYFPVIFGVAAIAVSVAANPQLRARLETVATRSRAPGRASRLSVRAGRPGPPAVEVVS